MKDKLNEDELLGWIDNWRDYCRESCIKESCVGDTEKCELAYKQVSTLIKKPQITKEWIEQEANKILVWCALGLDYDDAKKFIHSLIEEIQGVA